MKRKKAATFQYSWRAELDSFTIYQKLSHLEGQNKKGLLFQKLSQESLDQSKVWQQKDINGVNWTYTPSLRVKIVSLLLDLMGPKYLIDVLSAMKIRGLSLYRVGEHHEDPKTADEELHSKIKSGANLRASVFGVNDGLVSNASLVFAMVGAGSTDNTIILTGIAGLLAGGFSMAAGEFISVKSQTELYENQLQLEEAEFDEFPEEEAKELSLIYQAKGLSKDVADQITAALIKDKNKTLDTLAREELGINPDELSSPYQAALYSFISFSIGAIIPIIPFLLSFSHAASFSMGMAVTGLFLTGLFISLLTGSAPIWSALRMTIVGLLAGLSTYLIGQMIGVSVN